MLKIMGESLLFHHEFNENEKGSYYTPYYGLMFLPVNVYGYPGGRTIIDNPPRHFPLKPFLELQSENVMVCTIESILLIARES